MKKASFRIYFAVYLVALVLSAGSVTWLKLFAINPATGFIDATTPIATVLMHVSRLSLLLPIFFWFLITIRRPAAHDFPVSYRHVPTSVLGVLTGIAMMLYTITTLSAQIINQYAKDLHNKFIVLLVLFCGVVGGISMIVGSVRPKYGVSGKPGAMLGFVPALWQLLSLLMRFNSFMAITTVVDTLLLILFMSFAAMFLIGQSRIVFGLGIRNGQTYALPSGLSVSLVGLTFVISNVIYFIVNRSNIVIVPMGFAEFFYVATLSLYSVVFLLGFARSIRKV